ncbi:hypothetical protein BJY04DRAFT_216337 [Aspergillus karnatakaensis]|uniref:uncharacterized protein n=1 Tax=Aspergillus karnatakaensis TaxID=1810916 RepID=UPI003CCCA19D
MPASPPIHRATNVFDVHGQDPFVSNDEAPHSGEHQLGHAQAGKYNISSLSTAQARRNAIAELEVPRTQKLKMKPKPKPKPKIKHELPRTGHVQYQNPDEGYDASGEEKCTSLAREIRERKMAKEGLGVVGCEGGAKGGRKGQEKGKKKREFERDDGSEEDEEYLEPLVIKEGKPKLKTKVRNGC